MYTNGSVSSLQWESGQVKVSARGADPLANLRVGKRCMLDSLNFAVVVTNYSYVQRIFDVFNGFMTKKRQLQPRRKI